MKNTSIAQQRLCQQGLTDRRFTSAEEIVSWLGAVQAQDYHGAKWSLGLRIQGATDAVIEQAYDEGRILRTHMMRPTWHFVTPEDIRWILALTSARVHALNAYMYRQQELDDELLARGSDIIARALEGGNFLTRAEIGGVLAEAGIEADGIRLGYIIHHAELNAVICSGPRRGKQFTYALMDERAPQGLRFEGENALAELMLRFFTGHGPATLHDFAWWSGLTVTDAKKGANLLHGKLFTEEISGTSYWFTASSVSDANVEAEIPAAMILPFFDEYTIAFKSLSDGVLAEEHVSLTQSMLLGGSIVLNGQILGSWRRMIKSKELIIELAPFRAFTPAELEDISDAAARYGEFLGLPARCITYNP